MSPPLGMRSEIPGKSRDSVVFHLRLSGSDGSILKQVKLILSQTSCGRISSKKFELKILFKSNNVCFWFQHVSLPHLNPTEPLITWFAQFMCAADGPSLPMDCQLCWIQETAASAWGVCVSQIALGEMVHRKQSYGKVFPAHYRGH